MLKKSKRYDINNKKQISTHKEFSLVQKEENRYFRELLQRIREKLEAKDNIIIVEISRKYDILGT